MKDFIVYIKVEKYIKEWLIHNLGSPVRFPQHSYESELLRHSLRKRPRNAPPVLMEQPDTVPVVIPDDSLHRPEYYNYLGRHAQRAMQSAIDGLFRLALWSDCAPLLHSKRELNRGIDEWCQRNGITLDNREAVRQKFYRIRKSYRIKGIILGKIYRKKLP